MNVRSWISAGAAGAAFAALLVMLPVTSAGAAGSYISVSPNPMNFGRIPSGTSKLLAAVVTNTSSRTINVGGAGSAQPMFSDDQASAPGVPRDHVCNYYNSVQDHYYNFPVAPGGTCLVYYRFAPTADGFYRAQVRISATNPGDDSQLEDQFLDLEGLARQIYPLATTGGLTLSREFVDWVDIMIGETASKPLTVTNTSNGMVQVTTAYSPGQFRDRTGPTKDGDCIQYGGAVRLARKLDPGDSCTVQVEYAPTTTGSTAAYLTVGVVPTSGDPGDVAPYSSSTTLATQQIRVSGNGRGMFVSASPTALAFGSVTRGTTKVLSTVIKNTDPVLPAQFDAVYPAGSQLHSYEPATPASTDCASHGGSRVIQPGQTCTLRVEYAPTVNGAISNVVTLRVHPAAAGAGTGFPAVTRPTAGSANVTATGTGLAAKFSAPTSLAFSNVTVTGTKALAVTMRNTGTGPLEFGFPSSGTGPFSIDLPATQSAANCLFGTRHQVIAAGKTCTVTVRFNPTATGAASATIPVQALSPGGSAAGTFDPAPGIVLGEASVKATGAGIAPTSTLNPTAVAFGNVTLQGTKKVQVTVKNTSSATVTYRSTYSAPGPYQVVTPTQRSAANCTNLGVSGMEYQAIAPGGSCILTFSFTPTGLGAAPATTFAVATSSASTAASGWGSPGVGLASSSLRATGTGIAATFSLTPASLFFGNVKVGTSKILKTVVKNTSTTPVRYAVSFPAGSAYHLATTTGTDLTDCIAITSRGTTYLTVAVGASCNLRIEYSPTTVGAANATFTVKAYASSSAPGTYSPTVGTTAIGTKTINATGKGI